MVAKQSATEAAKIKGQWGRGGRESGNLVCLEKAELADLKEEYKDQILALRGNLGRAAWYKAKSLGLRGIICGGLSEEGLSEEIDKGVLRVEGEEKRIILPLIILGKKSQIPEEAWQALKENQGKNIILEGDKNQILIPK